MQSRTVVVEEKSDDDLQALVLSFADDAKTLENQYNRDRDYDGSTWISFILDCLKALIPYAHRLGAAGSVLLTVIREGDHVIQLLEWLQQTCPEGFMQTILGKLMDFSKWVGTWSDKAAVGCQVIQVAGAIFSAIMAWKNVYVISKLGNRIETVRSDLSDWVGTEFEVLNRRQSELRAAWNRLNRALEDYDFAVPSDQQNFRNLQLRLMTELGRYRQAIANAEEKLRQIDREAKDSERKAKQHRNEAQAATFMGAVGTAVAVGATAVTGGAAAPVAAACINGIAVAGGIRGWVISNKALKKVRGILNDIDRNFEKLERHWSSYNEIVDAVKNMCESVENRADEAQRRLVDRQVLDEERERHERRARELEEQAKQLQLMRRAMEEGKIRDHVEGAPETTALRLELERYGLAEFLEPFQDLGIQRVEDLGMLELTDIEDFSFNKIQIRKFTKLVKDAKARAW